MKQGYHRHSPWAAVRRKLWAVAAAVMVSAFSLQAQPGGADTSRAAGLQISLLTCSPGTELYTTFGHSAFRIRDSLSGLDVVFNYGTFDFDTPNFYWKFVRGKLLYMLSVQPMDRFMQEYRYENRGVVEQVLQLDGGQKRRAINFLQTNYLPSNREYLYDFFFDNCATRLRDIAERELGVEVTYTHQAVEAKTFRQLLHDYLPGHPWVAFGFDLGLGLPADRPADFREQMFLPDYLAANLSRARIDGRPLLGPPQRLLPDGVSGMTVSGPLLTPFVVFFILALLSLWITLRGSEGQKQKLDRYLFLALGLVGFVLAFLWFGTDHKPTVRNLNLIWANPLYLAVLAGWRHPAGTVRKYLYAAAGLLSLAVLAAWPLSPQQFHPAIIPILACVIMRCGERLFRVYRQVYS